jgi:hypothetical protein
VSMVGRGQHKKNISNWGFVCMVCYYFYSNPTNSYQF